MIVLGIETTAHTFGCSLLVDGKIISNEKSVYHTESGGMIPAKVADHHVEVCGEVLQKALKEHLIKDVDVFAVSSSPGLGHALRIGNAFAKSLAILHKKPLVPVNHCIAHLEIGRYLLDCKDPVLLYASGANTQIITFEAGKYRVIGETLDVGVGNFIDTFGRLLGLGFPAGPAIEKLASEGKRFIELPYSVKGMDVSFGGLLTNLRQKINSGKYNKEDLCYSVQETVFAMLVEVAERAMAQCDKKELLLGGGVACNKRLKQMAEIMCRERGAKCFCPENQYLVDNAAMIAVLGKIMFESGHAVKPEDSRIDPYERTDDVEVDWR